MSRPIRLISIVSVLVVCAVVGTLGQGGGTPWPPGLQPVSDDSPALTASEEAKTFFVAPGYRLELVAEDPMIADPIVIEFDTRGRMWVLEMPGYQHDVVSSGEGEPSGRVVVLEDRNGDGKMDLRTTFIDNLVVPRAMKLLDQGVLIGEPPNLWFARDTNGDLRADSKELVTKEYGNGSAGVEHNLNGLNWTLDNWMHTSEGNIDLRRKNGKFEIRTVRSPGQWGNTQDDAGRIYRNSNESVLHVDLIDQSYYARHPGLTRSRGSYETLEGANDEVSIVYPVRPTRGVNRGYQLGVLRDDGSLRRVTAVCAPTVYRGDQLPDLYGNMFVAEPAGNLVSRIVLSDDGKTVRAKKAYDNAEFIASTDERFRPVYFANAPDGTFYVVDMYKAVLQQRSSITEYLLGQIRSRRLQEPQSLGRVWRVMHTSTTRSTALHPTDTPAQLVTLLAHANGWWRDTAQRLLVERNAQEAVPALVRLVESHQDPRTRLHALWTLNGLDALPKATAVKALEDTSRDVRAAAIRVSERWLAQNDGDASAAVMKRLTDSDWAVRQQLAASLGTLPLGQREAAMVSLLTQASDPVVVDVALSGLRGAEVAVLEQMLKSNARTPEREAAVVMLAATALRGGQDAPAQRLFQWMTERNRAEWQRTALLLGAEVALTGAAAPGDAPLRGGEQFAPPCATCPGARGGPGGGSAFGGRGGGAAGGAARAAGAGAANAAATGRGTVAPGTAQVGAARGAAAPAGGGGRGGGRGGGAGTLRLSQPPAIAAAANPSPELAKRFAAVLERVSWPGKPGSTPIVPLTPAEQKRFAAGAEVYKNLCVACHQSDGRGQARMAASLIGSDLVIGAPEVPIRILMNGKEGTVGLMVPLGGSLSDDQVAGVLTYIRREWGQTATAVDPVMVATIRAESKARTRPWTNDELLSIRPANVVGP